MIRFIFILGFLLSSFVTAFGQNLSSQRWHKGWVVTSEQDTVRGAIMYDMDAGSIKVAVDEVILTYSPRKLLFATIFDESLQNHRQFYSLPYTVSAGYKAPVLFEVLYEGPLTLLIRESIVEETLPAMYAYSMGPGPTRQRISYTYYFLDKNGKIVELTGKKRDLISHFGNKATKIKQFMKDNKLKSDRMRDLVRITAFYNSLL